MSAPALLESQRVRQEIRAGRITGTSRGLAHGFVQCNLAIVPKEYAFDFLLYCQRNQRACPVLEVTDPGSITPKKLAPTADLRTDCARYAIYRDGIRVEDRTEITDLWRDDLVTFLIGSGISIDGALENAGVPTHKDRWVLRTTLPTEPAGPFRGDMIVTMRWLTGQQAITATQVTSRFPFNHGAPIHLGDPAEQQGREQEPRRVIGKSTERHVEADHAQRPEQEAADQSRDREFHDLRDPGQHHEGHDGEPVLGLRLQAKRAEPDHERHRDAHSERDGLREFRR